MKTLSLQKLKPKKLSLLWFLIITLNAVNMTSNANIREIFKDIPNFEGYYQISNLGNVKSLERKVKHSKGGLRIVKEKILKPTDDGKGYLRAMLQKQGKIKLFQVHQLVAMAFLNHKPCGFNLVVDHIDNNPSNNCVNNLQVITQRENVIKDSVKKSSKYRGVFKRSNGRFRVLIYFNGKNHGFGTYKTEKIAAAVYEYELNKINNNLKQTK